MEKKKNQANRYERTPMVVHAIQWTGRNYEEVELMTNESSYLLNKELYVNLAMGETIRVLPGDFILKTSLGRIFTLPPNEFHQDYKLGSEL